MIWSLRAHPQDPTVVHILGCHLCAANKNEKRVYPKQFVRHIVWYYPRIKLISYLFRDCVKVVHSRIHSSSRSRS